MIFLYNNIYVLWFGRLNGFNDKHKYIYRDVEDEWWVINGREGGGGGGGRNRNGYIYLIYLGVRNSFDTGILEA